MAHKPPELSHLMHAIYWQQQHKQHSRGQPEGAQCEWQQRRQRRRRRSPHVYHIICLLCGPAAGTKGTLRSTRLL